jgi:hypothetical protein
MRIAWETQRLAVWHARGEILEKLDAFIHLSTWSTSIYNEVSLTALSRPSSRSPDMLYPNILSPAARARRRQQSESIMHLVQELITHLTTFRRRVFSLPGATMDKMIETSTKKIPDVMLDVQDKLEDESRPLDSLDKFVSVLQTQWKK